MNELRQRGFPGEHASLVSVRAPKLPRQSIAGDHERDVVELCTDRGVGLSGVNKDDLSGAACDGGTSSRENSVRSGTAWFIGRVFPKKQWLQHPVVYHPRATRYTPSNLTV